MHILFYKNKKYPSAQVFRKYTCTNGYFIKIIWLQKLFSGKTSDHIIRLRIASISAVIRLFRL